MDLINVVLTAVFSGAAIWMGKKVIEQRKQMVIAGKFINGYRLFVMFCFAASVLTLFMGFTDAYDLIRSIAMLMMVGLFLCLREGVGNQVILYNGTMIPYEAVSHYDIKKTDKLCELYVVCREKVKDKVEESTFVIKFSKTNETELVELLNQKLPKKQKRMKKI